MKVLLDIQDSKVSFVLELLNSLNYVKVKPFTENNDALISDIKESVEELNLIKEGKLKGILAKDMLSEL